MEKKGLGEIKVKVQNGKVIKAWKWDLVKMVYNISQKSRLSIIFL